MKLYLSFSIISPVSESNLNSHIHDDNPHHITPYMIGAADSDHTHLYAGSSSTGGPADYLKA